MTTPSKVPGPLPLRDAVLLPLVGVKAITVTSDATAQPVLS